MTAKIPLLVLLVVGVGVAVAAEGGPSLPAPHNTPHQPPASSHPKVRGFTYKYGVRDDTTGTDYGQDVQSDGNVIIGSYHVALPDGRKQTVKYQADHLIGYVADVEFEGVATHPIIDPHHHPTLPHYIPTPS